MLLACFVPLLRHLKHPKVGYTIDMDSTNSGSSAQQALVSASPFLRLPPGIRNQIYDAVLESAGDLELRLLGGENAVFDKQLSKKAQPSKDAEQPPRLSFFSTCKQIREESLGLVYSNIHLSVELPPDMSGRNYANTIRWQARENENIVQNLIAAFSAEALQSIQHIRFSDNETFRRFYRLDSDFRAFSLSSRTYTLDTGKRYDPAVICKYFTGVKTITISGYEHSRYHARADVPFLAWDIDHTRYRRLCEELPSLERIEAEGAGKTQRYVVRIGRVYVAETGKAVQSVVDIRNARPES